MQAQLFAGSQQRQAPFAVFVFFTIVETHVIDGQKAGHFEDRPSGAEGIRRWGCDGHTRRNINRHAIKDRRGHLAGNKALPNQIIQA